MFGCRKCNLLPKAVRIASPDALGRAWCVATAFAKHQTVPATGSELVAEDRSRERRVGFASELFLEKAAFPMRENAENQESEDRGCVVHPFMRPDRRCEPKSVAFSPKKGGGLSWSERRLRGIRTSLALAGASFFGEKSDIQGYLR